MADWLNTKQQSEYVLLNILFKLNNEMKTKNHVKIAFQSTYNFQS